MTGFPPAPSTSHGALSTTYGAAQLCNDPQTQLTTTGNTGEYVKILPRLIVPLTEWQRARDELYRDDNAIELNQNWPTLEYYKATRFQNYLPEKHNRGRNSWEPIANTLCAINDAKTTTSMELEVLFGNRNFYNHINQLHRWKLLAIRNNKNKAAYYITPNGRLVAEALRDGRDSITKLRDFIKHLDMSDYPTHRALQTLMDEAILRYEINP